MTIPKPVEDLIMQAKTLASNDGTPTAKLSLLRGSLTRLRNQFYAQLDDENLQWDDPKSGNPELLEAKREIDSTLDFLTSRIMSATQQEAVSTSLADREVAGEHSEERPSASLAELIVQLG